MPGTRRVGVLLPYSSPDKENQEPLIHTGGLNVRLPAGRHTLTCRLGVSEQVIFTTSILIPSVRCTVLR